VEELLVLPGGDEIVTNHVSEYALLTGSQVAALYGGPIAVHRLQVRVFADGRGAEAVKDHYDHTDVDNKGQYHAEPEYPTSDLEEAADLYDAREGYDQGGGTEEGLKLLVYCPDGGGDVVVEATLLLEGINVAMRASAPGRTLPGGFTSPDSSPSAVANRTGGIACRSERSSYGAAILGHIGV
jgi:hypothetical protein